MTDMIRSDEQVLKADALGRIKTPVARREQLLDEFERSGLSGIKFAALAGVKYATFAAWLSRRRRKGESTSGGSVKPVDSMHWLEAVVEQAAIAGGQNPTGVVLELPGRARVQISNANQAMVVAALLRALEKSC